MPGETGGVEIENGTQEVVAEVKQEGVCELKKEVVSDLKQEVVPDLKKEILADLPQEVVSDLKQEVVCDLKQEVASDLKQEVVQEVREEIAPEIQIEIAPDTAPEVQEVVPEDKEPVPEVAEVPEIKEVHIDTKPEIVAELKQETVPEVKKEIVPEREPKKEVHTTPVIHQNGVSKKNMSTSMDVESVRSAYKDVRSDSTDTQWAVFKFNGPKIVSSAKGVDFEAFKGQFRDNERAFGYIRIQTGDEMSKRQKFLLITFVGPLVSVLQRAKMSTDKSVVKNVISSFAVELQLENTSEIDLGHFVEELNKAGGANYGTGVREI